MSRSVLTLVSDRFRPKVGFNSPHLTPRPLYVLANLRRGASVEKIIRIILVTIPLIMGFQLYISDMF